MSSCMADRLLFSLIFWPVSALKESESAVDNISGQGTRDSDADKELVKSREFIEVATQIWLEAM